MGGGLLLVKGYYNGNFTIGLIIACYRNGSMMPTVVSAIGSVGVSNTDDLYIIANGSNAVTFGVRYEGKYEVVVIQGNETYW